MEYERYISDGILERYFLGFATPEEEAELQVHMNIFPELQTEMDAVERRIEKAAFKDAVLPPAHIKASLMHIIAEESAGAQNYSYNVNYSDVKAPSDKDKLHVHIAWKIVLILLLSMIAISLLAAIIFYLAASQK